MAGTRRVGHAGTLDPMATGVLIVGVGRATRLLGHLALHDKDYRATIRLGQTTTTEDAEGELVAIRPTDAISPDGVARAAARFVGDIDQRPPAVSALKVDGKRAYARVRAGQQVELAARPVRILRLDVCAVRRQVDTNIEVVDVDIDLTCSSGTYVRALARDLGEVLGVGGHLIALRRTRVGDFHLAQARTLADLERSFELVPINDVAAGAFPRRDLDTADAVAVSHGGRLPASGTAGPVAAFGPDGTFLALLEDRDGAARPLAVFVDDQADG